MSRARTAFKCQVATAESLAVSVMQEPGDIWECRVTEGVAVEGGKAEAMGGEGRRGCRFPGKRGEAKWGDEAGQVEG